VILTPGGGGYGDPRMRDPELVRKDVANGLVSAESALKHYGVEAAAS
jgi:N-methylhydantoinase B